MKKTIITALVLLAIAGALSLGAQSKTTLKFAERDTCSLYMDLYMPSDTTLATRTRPLVIFIFGGGFQNGTRDSKGYVPWFEALCAHGYPVASIDYRLGLKGIEYKMSLDFVSKLEKAIDIAVEDLFSATNYILDNARALGLEGRGIVVSGSSAGALTSLQAEYYLANGDPKAAPLPQGFNYAGVMAFSGAIFSRVGGVKYSGEPCPQLLLHGTADRMVPYRQIKIFNLCLGGSSHIAKRLKKQGCNYQILRFDGNYHEICVSMMHNLGRELAFLRRNVERGEKTVIDALISDPSIPVPDWAKNPAVGE